MVAPVGNTDPPAASALQRRWPSLACTDTCLMHVAHACSLAVAGSATALLWRQRACKVLRLGRCHSGRHGSQASGLPGAGLHAIGEAVLKNVMATATFRPSVV